MGYKTITQLALIVLSVVIIFTFIKPKFEDMKAIQDETREYQIALNNAATFNQELTRLQAEADSFSPAELQALNRYLPTEVDPVAVMRDIESIVNNNNLVLSALASTEAVTPRTVVAPDLETSEAAQLTSQSFTLSVSGTYNQLKQLLQDFERNNYPLEVVSLTFTSNDEGTLYTFALTLTTFALSNQVN